MNRLDEELKRLHAESLPDEWATRLLPTRPDSKAMCDREGLIRQYTRTEIAYRCMRGCGLGMKPGDGAMCVDIDDASFRAEAKERFGLDSPLVVRSRRGFHLWMRTLLTDQKTVLKWRGLPIDFKFTGYMMWPPTVVDGFRYTLEAGLPSIAGLPMFPAELLTPTKCEIGCSPPVRSQPDWPEDRRLESARTALARRFSIAGSGGDLELFKAACLLIQFYRFDRETALALLREWNHEPFCQPPWPDGRLVYKVDQAVRLMR